MFQEHSGRVFRLQFDEFQIVSSSHDDTILIWDFLNVPIETSSTSSTRSPTRTYTYVNNWSRGASPLPLCVYVYVWWVLRRVCEETSSIPESTLCRNKVIMVCHLQCFGLAVSFSIDYLPSPSSGSWGRTDISLTSRSAWWWFHNIWMFVRVLSGLIIFYFHFFLDLWKNGFRTKIITLGLQIYPTKGHFSPCGFA